jgi:phosphoglycolate phosphatase-like HAD superfamily hydrolase
MNLVLFDIDGTLTQSQELDAEIYLRSLAEVFGFTGVCADWSAYRHTTDSGILTEVFETRLGRPPAPSEMAGMRAHFVEAIAAAALREPFREVRGARHALELLSRQRGWQVGLATGGWGESARCKLQSAGFRCEGLPLASADDALSRAAIMQIAIDRAARVPTAEPPDHVVYIGDGVWDARACRDLRIPFIGIATGKQEQRLRTEGAAAVFADYTQIAEMTAALVGAR